MMVRNHVDRFHLAMEAFSLAEDQGIIDAGEAKRLHQKYEEKLIEHKAYIMEFGDDPEIITNWIWQLRS